MGIVVFTSVFQRAVPWLRQPSTITGISTLAGLGVALVTGEMTWQIALPVGVGAVVAMLLPGHDGAQAAMTRVAVDAAAASDPTTRIAALRDLSRDIPAAVKAALPVDKSQ